MEQKRKILIRYRCEQNGKWKNHVRQILAPSAELSEAVLKKSLVSKGVEKDRIVVYRYFDVTDSDKEHIENIMHEWTFT